MFHRRNVVSHLVIHLQCTLSQHCGRGTWTEDQPEDELRSWYGIQLHGKQFGMGFIHTDVTLLGKGARNMTFAYR